MKPKKRSKSLHLQVQVKLNKEKIIEFQELTNKAENYFDFEKNPVLGKGHKGPRYENENIVKYSVVCLTKYEEQEKRLKKMSESLLRKSSALNGFKTSAGGFISSKIH